MVFGGVAAVIVVGLIYACSGGGTLSCDSGEVKKEVIKKMIAFFKPDFEVELSNIVTDSVDKEAKRVKCRADTNILWHGVPMTNFGYTAQRTSDGKLIVKLDTGL